MVKYICKKCGFKGEKNILTCPYCGFDTIEKEKTAEELLSDVEGLLGES